MYKTHVDSVDRSQWCVTGREVEILDEIGCWNMQDGDERGEVNGFDCIICARDT